jgi:adenylate kinase family enzyme
MIIWINGPFGSGKTTLAKKLEKDIPNSMIFDPEQVGVIINRQIPESKGKDFQDFKMWRDLVPQFIIGFKSEFDKTIIIPMTLVNQDYLKEIFSKLKEIKTEFHHFYLNIELDILKKRLTDQVMDKDNKNNNEEICQWRLAQMERCLSAVSIMPLGTNILDSGSKLPDVLSDIVLETVNN